MVQSPPKLITIDEFITNYGDRDSYELIDGELIEMEPTGPHEQVSGFLGRKLNVEIDRLDLSYLIPPRCLIKLLGTSTAFRSDVLILDQTRLNLNSRQLQFVRCERMSIKNKWRDVGPLMCKYFVFTIRRKTFR